MISPVHHMACDQQGVRSRKLVRALSGRDPQRSPRGTSDGASRIQAMVRISFPLARPRNPLCRIFAFTLSWNEFLYALVFLSSPQQKTIPIGVFTELVRGDVFYWGPLMAGALLGSIPVALVYSLFVEHYVTALTGAVKG